MSKKWDNSCQVKVWPDNAEALRKLKTESEFPTSFCAIANMAITHGIKSLRQKAAIAKMIPKEPYTEEQLREGWAGQKKKGTK